MRLVVGNRLTNFALATGAMTAREAIETLASGNGENGFILGQGIHDGDLRIINMLGKTIGVPIEVLEQDTLRAGISVCHKHKLANQLISIPRKIGEHIFEADMLIDDRNEIMSDHITGSSHLRV